MKRIKLENFRCYDNIEINFKRGINLLIGDNASGKTSVFFRFLRKKLERINN